MFGWKKKVEIFRMVLLSSAHQLAKDLPPGFTKLLAIFKRVDQFKSYGTRALEQETERVLLDHADEPKPLWEPVEVHGWRFQATMYLQSNQIWWLVRAARANERSPSDKDVAFLNKILEILGADPKRDMIIGPGSGPHDEGLLPFGWWTWFNRAPLYEIQVNKDKKKDKEKIRIVPLGTRETDGYQSFDLLAEKEPPP
jgi:hypothetical protein